MSEFSMEELEALSRQKLEGKSYAEIRVELSESGLNQEEVRKVIRQVDEIVLKAETLQKHTEKTRQWNRAGLVLAVGGLIISIAYNAGFILSGWRPWIVYAPFIAGILLMFYGRMQGRKQPEPFKKGPGRIRSKRPYK